MTRRGELAAAALVGAALRLARESEQDSPKSLEEQILPIASKSYLFTPPGPNDITDIVLTRDAPIINNPNIDRIAEGLLAEIYRKAGIDRHVNGFVGKLDKFWVREYAATLLAFTLLQEFHRHQGKEDYTPEYQEYLPGRHLRYKRLVDSIKQIMPDLKEKKSG